MENDVITEKKDVLIDNGKIIKIEDKIEEQVDKIINAQNHIVMPGLINTHAHIPMSIFRETTEGCKLYEWLNDKIWPIEDKLTREDIYWASMLSYIEMISTGTTCVNDQYFMPEQIREAAVKSGARAVITRPIVDMSGDLQERINEFRNFYESRDESNDLITYSVAPHSLYTCSDKALEACADLAKEYNLPIHTHFLESIDEIEDIKNKHGRPAIQVLKDYFSDVHTILAHCVKLTDEDIEILKTMDCGINGAKLLQLDNKIGSIEVGKDADIILVNIEEKLDNITMLPNLNEIANLVYNTSGRNVDTTIVKGNILMENREIKHIDVKETVNKCNQILERLSK